MSRRVVNTKTSSSQARRKQPSRPAGARAQLWPPQREGLWKAYGERMLALGLLIPALPVIGVLVLLVRMTSPGPGLFRQTRVGRGGGHFTLCKIRTMRVNAEEETGPVWSSGKDKRVIWCGDFLRTTHLDELPQLFQVVQGHMNLVGPRPERPEIVPRLAAKIPEYLDRLAVKPGVTGLAQITFGPDIDIHSVWRKLILDKLYISTRSVSLDLRIIACTSLSFFGAPYHFARRATLLDRVTSLDFDALLEREDHAEPEELVAFSTDESNHVVRPK